jgi:hypothetical protein
MRNQISEIGFFKIILFNRNGPRLPVNLSVKHPRTGKENECDNRKEYNQQNFHAFFAQQRYPFNLVWSYRNAGLRFCIPKRKPAFSTCCLTH